jgi:hypothetical protein
VAGSSAGNPGNYGPGGAWGMSGYYYHVNASYSGGSFTFTNNGTANGRTG